MAKSVIAEARDIALASELIRLGARLQVLESETKLSREKLLRLYKEIQGKSPRSLGLHLYAQGLAGRKTTVAPGGPGAFQGLENRRAALIFEP